MAGVFGTRNTEFTFGGGFWRITAGAGCNGLRIKRKKNRGNKLIFG
jgi:hypothetical protein